MIAAYQDIKAKCIKAFPKHLKVVTKINTQN